jgi:hypothetical protein
MLTIIMKGKGTMRRLKHKTRRRGLQGDPGVILVGKSKYQIDENGEVVVGDEDAVKMLQGANWGPVAEVKKPHPESRPFAEAGQEKPEEQKYDKSRDDLLAEAESLGLKVDKRLSTAKIVNAIQAAKEEGEK